MVTEPRLACSLLFLSSVKGELFNTVMPKTLYVTHVLHVKAYCWARGSSTGRALAWCKWAPRCISSSSQAVCGSECIPGTQHLEMEATHIKSRTSLGHIIPCLKGKKAQNLTVTKPHDLLVTTYFSQSSDLVSPACSTLVSVAVINRHCGLKQFERKTIILAYRFPSILQGSQGRKEFMAGVTEGCCFLACSQAHSQLSSFLCLGMVLPAHSVKAIKKCPQACLMKAIPQIEGAS